MWIVMHIARGKALCDRLVSLLEANGILVNVKPTYKNMPESQNDYQIRVLKSEAEQARSVLIKNGF